MATLSGPGHKQRLPPSPGSRPTSTAPPRRTVPGSRGCGRPRSTAAWHDPGSGLAFPGFPPSRGPYPLGRLVEVDVDGSPGTTGQAPVGLAQLVALPRLSTHDPSDAITVLQVAGQRVDRPAPPQDRGVAQR